jgi:hypothetical protein
MRLRQRFDAGMLAAQGYRFKKGHLGLRSLDRHCEERADEAIQSSSRSWIASLRSQ